MKTMLTIDGKKGEGGGQILRTSLALSLVTGRPVRIVNIRAGRQKPGLLRQHLTAVQAAARISGGEVQGAAIGSSEVTLSPGAVRGGEYEFSVGTAGSATLVLQTILPALMSAGEPSTVVLEGGTHNPSAPPFDFLVKAFLPLLARIGPQVTATLERPGFFPAGGGRFRVTVQPHPLRSDFQLLERGATVSHSARAVVASLPANVGHRELRVVSQRLGWSSSQLEVEHRDDGRGAGNVLMLELAYEHVTEVFTAFGEKGVSAERVAEAACEEAERYLQSGAPVGEHLADQLLLPLALAGGGSFVTTQPSLHTTTQAMVIEQFLEVNVALHRRDTHTWMCEVSRRPRT